MSQGSVAELDDFKDYVTSIYGLVAAIIAIVTPTVTPFFDLIPLEENGAGFVSLPSELVILVTSLVCIGIVYFVFATKYYMNTSKDFILGFLLALVSILLGLGALGGYLYVFYEPIREGILNELILGILYALFFWGLTYFFTIITVIQYVKSKTKR